MMKSSYLAWMSLILLLSVGCDRGVPERVVREDKAQVKSSPTLPAPVLAAVARIDGTSVIEAFREIPQAGLHEVFTNSPVNGDRVLYLTKDAKTLLVGEAIDMSTGTSLTASAINSRRLGLLQSEAAERTVSFPSSSQRATVYVFTDASCEGCKEFHADVERLNSAGVSVEYLSFASQGAEGETFDRLKSVWCAANRQESLAHALGGAKFEPVVGCKDVVEHQLRLGLRLGVMGVPTIITENGVQFPGYPGYERLLKAIVPSVAVPAVEQKPEQS